MSIKRGVSCVPGFQGRWLAVNSVEGEKLFASTNQFDSDE
jgi:hypothetical protein